MPPPRPLLAACAILVAFAGAVQAQPAPPPADTSSTVRVSFRPIPAGFYSPSKGIGVGVGATVYNLGWRGSVLDVTAEPMTNFGRYSAWFATGDPFRSPLYAGVGLIYTGASAYRFYGLGPRRQRTDQVSVRMRTVELEARGGVYPLGSTRLLVQPVARLLYGLTREIEDAREGAFDRLDPASQANLLRAEGNPSLGVTYGLELIFDGLDQPLHPYAGSLVQLTGRRYDGLDDDPFRYWAATATLYGFLPITGGRTVLESRAVLAWTRPIGERPIPFYALPQLDTRFLGGYTVGRFVGRDLIALSTALRFPVFDLLGWYGLEGFVGIHAANAYDDLFTQFVPGVTFDRVPEADGLRTPLRPALALGGYILDLPDRQAVLSGQIGLSPEGLELATLQFVYDLRIPRAPLR